MLANQVLLARLQFALTVGYHFIFVPISIGIGLVMAIFVTRAFKSKNAEDDAIARFLVKIFTATFAIGVATGITMEFSFGTNWANYSRFVGDIFGAPLAAEALFAFFLESIFLGILLFGKNKVKPVFYTISAWLVFVGSALSALWILIANSWMQTPAGATLSSHGAEAIITDFFAAAFNPSTLPRYCHTVTALIVMGAFLTMAVGAWYMHKKKHENQACKLVRTGAAVGVIGIVLLLGAAHSSAVEVWNEQPTKLAMMEGMYETEVPELSIVGIVDEENQDAKTLAIAGGTSFLATGAWDTEYLGLNDLAKTDKYSDIVVEDMPVNFVFQSYHIMVALFGVMLLCLFLVLLFGRKKAKHNIKNMKWLQWLIIISPLFPFIAIQTGWITAEVGRQPYVVYPSTSGPDGVFMLTKDAISVSVQSIELTITMLLFVIVYILLFIGWLRVVVGFIKRGPVIEGIAVDANGKQTPVVFDFEEEVSWAAELGDDLDEEPALDTQDFKGAQDVQDFTDAQDAQDVQDIQDAQDAQDAQDSPQVFGIKPLKADTSTADADRVVKRAQGGASDMGGSSRGVFAMSKKEDTEEGDN